MDFAFTLNHRPWSGQLADPNLTLLQFLRREGLTGAKEGCAEGDCGACSIALLDRGATGQPAWRSINSCLVPVVILQGREVLTSEGIGCPAKMHPVQQSMVNHHGSQCGYCTPGFICSLFEGYHRTDLKTQAQLTDQLAGNLCRCTGYRAIHDAACEALAGARASLLSTTANAPEPQNPPQSDAPSPHTSENFHRPATLKELLGLRASHTGLQLIAGSTELGLAITKEFHAFSGFLSTDAVPELHVLTRHDTHWEIGAAVPLTNIEDAVGPEFPALAKMLWLFGSRPIRNRATFGGNLATASPIGDSAPVLLALGASLVLAGQDGTRTVLLEEFFTGYRQTLLRSDEIIRAILLPIPHQFSGRRFERWYKVSRRLEMDISTVSGSFVVETDASGLIIHARLAFGGVAATPALALKTAACLLGKSWSRDTLQAASEMAQSEFSPLSDVRGSGAYRRQLIMGMVLRFFDDEPWSPPVDPISPISPITPLPGPHESAHLHVTGTARYTDDLPPAHGELTVWPVTSPHAHARITRRDATAARLMPGIHAVLLAEDVPGLNDVGAVRQDEVLLAHGVVSFHGHPVALVVGATDAQCRAAAAAVVVEYEPLPVILTIPEAIAAGSFHTEPNPFHRGDPDAVLTSAPHRFNGEFSMGGQEHFYLETHAARAIPAGDGSLHIISSTQHPSEIQAVVSHVLHLPRHQITVESPRMGGGFGGKETQGNTPAAFAALAAVKTNRPVRVRLNRDQDMQMSGHRHPFLAKYEVAHDSQGRLLPQVRSNLQRRLGAGPFHCDYGPCPAPSRQRLLYSQPASDRPCRQNTPLQQHRLPRFWRTAGDAHH